MKKFLLIILTHSFISCQNNESDSRAVTTDTTTKNNSTINKGVTSAKTYKNEKFGIEAVYPENWVAIEKTHPTSEAAINILPADRQPTNEFPLSVHGDEGLSFISIWPEGFGTELPSGTSKTFKEAQPALNLTFEVNTAESQVFLLDDGTPWAYFIKPGSYPAEWTTGGFIFAQIRVNNLKLTCLEKGTGKEIDMSKCDPLTGDKVKREGNIDENEKKIINQILKELKLK